MTAPLLSDFGTAVSFAENTANTMPQLLDSDVTFTDIEGDFDGGQLSLSGLLVEDTVSVRDQGNGAGQIGLSGADVTFSGVVVGSLVGGSAGADLAITFNSSATSVAIDALIQNLTYANSSDAPTENRDLVLNVVDAAGEDLGLAPPQFTQVTGAANPLENLFLIDVGTPSFIDIDGDGDLDLLIGEMDGRLRVYDKDDIGAGFTQMFGAANPFEALDLGSNTTPTIVDLDGDGDFEIFTGLYDGRIQFFDNGSGDASFVLNPIATNPFFTVDVGNRSAPTFVDLDEDGDLDMVVGHNGYHKFDDNGYVGFVTSTVFDNNDGDDGFTELSFAANPLTGLLPGASTPTFVDLDGDGDLDLVAGSQGGTIQVFDNDDGGLGFTELTGSANPFAGIDVGYDSAPSFVDIDGDGDLDMVLGASLGSMLLFENTTPRGVAISVTVNAEDDATTSSGVPSNIAVEEAIAADLDLSAVTLSDPDQNVGFTLTLTADSGVLTAASSAGVLASGVGSGTLVLAGLASAIESYLNSAGSIQYTGMEGVFGDNAASITLTANDGAADIAIGSLQIDITDVVDTQVGGSEADTLIGDDGIDMLFGNEGADVLRGGEGADTLNGGKGHDQLFGEAGNDVLIGGKGDDTFEGGKGIDSIEGDKGDDWLDGGKGDDVVRGGDGIDTLSGGLGDDAIYGGDGFDTALYIGTFDTTVDLGITVAQDTGHGIDSLNGIEAVETGAGADALTGTDNANRFDSGDGQDTIHTEGGDDTVQAAKGDDYVKGGLGNDDLSGGKGDDSLFGGKGNDTLNGNNGRDVLDGFNGDDALFGGGGGDWLDGGRGDDVLVGGAGTDNFIFGSGGGNDTVNDFDALNSKENINLAAVTEIADFADLTINHMVQMGDNVVIDDGDALSITLLNVDFADLGGNDFIF